MEIHNKEFNKKFHTEVNVNGEKLALNHFIQETLANMLIGFLKNLKEVDQVENIEIKVNKMNKVAKVDAHTYP